MSYKITNDCICCGTCLEKCPTNAIVEHVYKYEITDSCTDCGSCVESCPVGAMLNIFQ